MTVAALPAVVEYAEDGISTSFAVPFRFKAADDLIVERIQADGTVAPLQLNADYTVTGGTTDAGGTVTRAAATAGARLRIRRNTARAQAMRYPTGGRFPAESHEDALDRQMLIAQEQDAEQLDLSTRALMVPVGQTIGDLVVEPDTALVFDSDKNPVAKPIGSFPVGPAGPANSTFNDTPAVTKGAKPGNLSAIVAAPQKTGVLSYQTGDFTALIAADPRAGVFVPAQDDLTGARGAWVRAYDTSLNVQWFGAKGQGTDDLPALQAAADLGRILGLPVTIPATTGFYGVSGTFRPWFGIAGGGGTIRPVESARLTFADGRPVVRIGWKYVDFPTYGATEIIPISGFRVQGLGLVPATRSSNQATQNFNGDGIYFDQSCSGLTMRDVVVEYCRNGVAFDNDSGHLYIENVNSRLNWNGWTILNNSGDMSALNSNFSGNLFASITCSGDVGTGTHFGGIVGLTLIRCQLGFGPYAIYFPNGTSGAGLANFTAIHCSFESCGNRAIRIGEDGATPNRVCYDWLFESCVHTWANPSTPDGVTRVIQGEAAHPVQDYAVIVQQINADGVNYVRGDLWHKGYTGAHTFVPRLQAFILDPNGPDGYDAGGRERVINSSQPYYQVRASVGQLDLSTASSITLATFEVPRKWNKTLYGYIEFDLAYLNSSTNNLGVDVSVTATGATQSQYQGPLRSFFPAYVPIGGSQTPGRGNLFGKQRFNVGIRDVATDTHTITVKISAGIPVIINPEGRNGNVVLTISNSNGIV